jgi:hypothetical protein
MKDYGPIQKDSPIWVFFVRLSFFISLLATSFGIFLLPVDFWAKGYIAIGLYFTVNTSFTLAKTLRDEHEANKLINKINEVKTEKMLREFDLSAS